LIQNLLVKEKEEKVKIRDTLYNNEIYDIKMLFILNAFIFFLLVFLFLVTRVKSHGCIKITFNITTKNMSEWGYNVNGERSNIHVE
jgi:hypothetical protein